MVVTASVAKMADRADAAVFLGIAESNLAGRVTGGENRGVTCAARSRCPRALRPVHWGGKGSCRREAGDKAAGCVGARLEKQRRGAGGVRAEFAHRRDLSSTERAGVYRPVARNVITRKNQGAMTARN